MCLMRRERQHAIVLQQDHALASRLQCELAMLFAVVRLMGICAYFTIAGGSNMPSANRARKSRFTAISMSCLGEEPLLNGVDILHVVEIVGHPYAGIGAIVVGAHLQRYGGGLGSVFV